MRLHREQTHYEASATESAIIIQYDCAFVFYIISTSNYLILKY